MTEEPKRFDRDAAMKELMPWLDKTEKAFASLLPEHFGVERFKRLVVNAAYNKEKLLIAFLERPGTVYACLAQCADLGLEPDTPLGHAYLVPLRDSKGIYECHLWIGYKGYFDLSLRTGQVRYQKAMPVFHDEITRDLFEYQITPPTIRHDWALGIDRSCVPIPEGNIFLAPKNLAASYCRVELKSGALAQDLLEIDDIEARRQRSRARNHPKMPWITDYAAMARKSSVRSLFAKGETLISTEMSKAVEYERLVEDETASAEEAFDAVRDRATKVQVVVPETGAEQEFGHKPDDAELAYQADMQKEREKELAQKHETELQNEDPDYAPGGDLQNVEESPKTAEPELPDYEKPKTGDETHVDPDTGKEIPF